MQYTLQGTDEYANTKERHMRDIGDTEQESYVKGKKAFNDCFTSAVFVIPSNTISVILATKVDGFFDYTWHYFPLDVHCEPLLM